MSLLPALVSLGALRVLLRPQPLLRLAEGGDAALLADARAGQDDQAAGLGEDVGGSLNSLVHDCVSTGYALS